jgi:hypothetical protein
VSEETVNIDHLDTKDVLREGAIEEHEKLKKALWDHLVRLENNVAILEDLVNFRGLKMLRSAGRVVDWMGQNLYEYTLLVVWRLWDDRDRRSITLKRLRRLMWDGAREEFREALTVRFHALLPPRRISDILSRTTAVRHGRLAHIDEGYQFDEARRVAGVSVPELRLATDFLCEYFNHLQLGVHSFFELTSFERREGSQSQTERMLERLVLDSTLCRWYDERGPEVWWRSFAPRYSQEDIQWLSELRVRNGLDPIAPNPLEE